MPAYRISQAARLLGVSADTVRRWGDSGRLALTRDEGGRRWVEGVELAALAGSLAEEADQGAIRHSARNRFTGIVTKVTKDRVMSQVDLAAGPFRMVSLISTEAVEELGLDVGVMVVASVKATNVTLETPRTDGRGGGDQAPAGATGLARLGDPDPDDDDDDGPEDDNADGEDRSTPDR